MPEMIALKSLKHPRPLDAGDKFTVDEKSARILQKIGAAKPAQPRKRQAAATKLPAAGDLLGQSGEYGRRDMRAQD
jgi:hypothetical protein